MLKRPIVACSIMALVLVAELELVAHADPESGISVDGGPNAANLARESRVNRYGFTSGFGFYLLWPWTDRLSIAAQADLLYVPRGARIVDGEMHLADLRQHYLDLAMTARPSLRLGPMSVYLLLGGGPSFLLSANKKEVGSSAQDITSLLRRVDVVLRGGAGIAVHLPSKETRPFRPRTVFLEARYDRGLIDADAVNGGFDNRTTSLMLGVSIALTSPTAGPAMPPSPTDIPAPAAPVASN